MAPERVIFKELVTMLRGRPTGEMPALIADELARLGAAPARWAAARTNSMPLAKPSPEHKPAIYLMLFTHNDRGANLALVEQLRNDALAGRPRYAGQPERRP